MPNAYRIGVEWQAGWQINRVLEIKSNLAVSANKIGSYTAFIDDYDENWEWQGQVALPYTGTDIAFSPGIIAAAELKWSIFSHLPFFLENPLEVIWNAKYVSRQYLDNTGNEQNVIPSFFINDAAVRFQLKKNITISGNIFNVLNHRYYSNGWVYSSFLNGELQSDIGVYPQAGRHFFVGFEVGF
jgi:iron complex outermembrane receptor protein